MKRLPSLATALLLVATSPAFADSSPTPAAKPPTYQELEHRNKVLTELLNAYYARATQAEAQLIQLKAEQDVATSESAAAAKK